MAKKKRSSPPKPQGAGASSGAAEAVLNPGLGAAPSARATRAPAAPPTSAAMALPLEITRGDWTAIILSLMMFFAPALGVPHEEMLQDTLKSIIVSFMALGALLLLFWRQRNRREAFRWHALIWIPLALMGYALGSMVWSHTYLGGVEAVRWFIFAVIVWLALNTINRDRFDTLAWGIHLGAFAVALLGASQYWFDVRFIPQGPNPAATFVNRNFAAEFVACTVAASAYLLARGRNTLPLVFLAFSLAFNLVFLLMCGTRSAMIGTALVLLTMPVSFWLFRDKFAFGGWSEGKRILVIGTFLATLVVLGLIKAGNPAVELKDMSAWQHGLGRAATVATAGSDTSFSVRLVMWKATMRMIQARPYSGVGAGAWEVDIPLYQAEGSQLETDYYVHNEILQLIAEYGILGWLVLAFLLWYLIVAAWRTLANRTEEGRSDAPVRLVALATMLAFLVVSNAGFPWRLAATGAMFALALGVLGASDARLGYRGILASGRLPWKPVYSQVAAIASMVCIALAAYITQQAAECEQKIVRAVKLALGISQSKDYNNPKWDKNKAAILTLIKEGTDINPHYRKITPMVGDEMAKWGDWKNAVWVWESVVSSRPYVVAIMSNIARGYATLGNNEKAFEFLNRTKKMQPNAPTVRSLDVVLRSRTGHEAEAAQIAKQSMDAGIIDFDLVNAAYVLGMRAGNWDLALQGMELRNKNWPEQAVDGYLKIGGIYALYKKDEAKALAAYRQAIALSPDKDSVRSQVVPALQAKL